MPQQIIAAEIAMNQYFDKVPGNVWKYVDNPMFYATGFRRTPPRHENEFHHPAW